jgi:thiosulfate/3-mercaptopyruvate sulfurtransferase
MIKSTAVVLFSGFLLLGGETLSFPSVPAARKASFCPECWRFLDETWDLDLQGRCLASRKDPVSLEGVTARWLWCRTHDAWHRRPCGKGVLVASDVTALLVPKGSERVTARAYCPQDRMFSDLGREGLGCPKCGKPMIMADAVERSWFWCSSEKAWLTKRCSLHRTLHCCSARSGIVLALPWEVPLLGQVSLEESVRGNLRVEAEWLAAHLDDPHLVVIHVGFDPAEPGVSLQRSTYLDGHVQGARSIGWNELVVTRKGIPNEMPKVEQLVQLVRSLGINLEDRIVLYDTGYGVEAARAYLTFDYLGLGKKTGILDGQWARWKALKYPVSCMLEEVEPSAFVPELRQDILVSLSEMKDLSWMARQVGTNIALLDARSVEEFSGYRAGKGILRPGHIAGAANLCWNQLLESTDPPMWRPENELRALLESAGARPGRTIVTYCRTGTEASLLYVVAKDLGYETRFYDGSYYEWSREDEGPIEGSWARADRR